MPRPNLRVFPNPAVDCESSENSRVATAAEAFIPGDTVRVNAGETLALLMHAARTNRAWLGDFMDETFEVSSDFYEVLLAYKRIAVTDNARAA